MSKYPKVRIGDFVEHVVREVELEADKEYPSVGVKWYGVGVHVHEVKSGGSFNASRYEIKANDIIYNDMWARNGSVAIVPSHLDGAVASSHFPTFLPDLARVLPKYLEFYFKTPTFWDDCENASRGSTGRNQIKKSTFYAIEIPLPSLEEQRRIVAHIESLAARVNEAQRLREEIAESLNDFVASYHVHYSDKTAKLSDVLVLDEDKEIVNPENSYPQIGVKGFGKGLFARETLSGTQTNYKWFNRLYYGAVVLSQVKGWEGAIGVVDKSLVGKFASPEYRTFRCKPNQALPEYLSELFATPWFYLQLKTLSRGVGGRRERIRPELFVELEIPMPDIERQKRAVEVFAKFPALRELQSASGEELSALMPSILDKAFKGEL